MTDPNRLTRKEALRLLALAARAAEGAPAAFAHEGHSGHAAGGMTAAPDASPSTAAYEAAAARMHGAMAIDYTGDADVDFVRGMIAHNHGAIDMAKVVLEYGEDPGIRGLAQGIVAAQEQEIAEMEAWLAAHGGDAGVDLGDKGGVGGAVDVAEAGAELGLGQVLGEIVDGGEDGAFAVELGDHRLPRLGRRGEEGAGERRRPLASFVTTSQRCRVPRWKPTPTQLTTELKARVMARADVEP